MVKRVKRVLLNNLSLFLGVVGGFAFGAVILELTGTNPFEAYRVLFKGTWGTLWGINQTVQKMIPLALVGLGLAVSFTSKLINIGGEGQIYAGGIVGSLVAIYCGFLPGAVLIPFMLVAAFLAGILWALVPAVLRTFCRVDEVITTLMLNYVGLWLLDFLVRGPLTDPASPGVEQSMPFAPASKLPIVIPGTRIGLGFLIVLVTVGLVYILLWKTVRGYEFRAMGVNPEASRYGGIDLIYNTMAPLLFSGGLAGLAGIVELAGVQGRLVAGFSPGYGYTAIAVALLARLNPGGVLLSAFLFATLLVGGDAMQYDLGVPTYLSMVMQAAIVILTICGDAIKVKAD